MLFCDTELARRVERAERGLVEACAAAVARRARTDVFTRPLAGGLAVCAGADAPMTKVVGLGFGGLPAAQELEEIEAAFFARGASVQVELCNLAEAGLAELLTRRGYALVGFENVSGRALDARETWREREGIAVARSGDEELETWMEVVVDAFATPDTQGVAAHEQFPREAVDSALRDMARADGLVRYLARRAGTPAGGASMRLVDGIAQLCGAGTVPAQRRRGVQGALLERRLVDAARQGCDLAIVTTLPGSKSQQNAQKQGFVPLYTRAILRRARA